MRWFVAVFALGCALLAGCESNDDRDDAMPGGGGLLPEAPGSDGPTGGGGGDPSGPGVEPPVTGSAGIAAGAPNEGQPSGMNAPDPAQPGAAGADGMSGLGTVAGTAGEMQPTVPDGADCAALTACDLETPCPTAGDHCIVLPSCAAEPKCLPPEDACQRECGEPNCAILESYPEQIACG